MRNHRRSLDAVPRAKAHPEAGSPCDAQYCGCRGSPRATPSRLGQTVALGYPSHESWRRQIDNQVSVRDGMQAHARSLSRERQGGPSSTKRPEVVVGSIRLRSRTVMPWGPDGRELLRCPHGWWQPVPTHLPGPPVGYPRTYARQ
jgi:hypothetical protein